MRKRNIISLILLLSILTVAFASKTVSVSLNYTKSGGRCSLTVSSLRLKTGNNSYTSADGYTLLFSLGNEHGPYYNAPQGFAILENVNVGNYTIYIKVASEDYVSDFKTVTIKNNTNSVSSIDITVPEKNDTTKYGLGEDARLYFFPRNVVNNSSVLVNLSTPKSKLSAGIVFTPNFINNSNENLALFRIRENLMSEAVENGQSSNRTDSITITIESDSDWTFVSEYNSTRTTEFFLDAFCSEAEYKYDKRTKKTSYEYANDAQLSGNSTLGRSRASATINKVGNVYELQLPYTYFEKGTNRYYPKFTRDVDICLRIPEFGTGLEPGYYSTTFRVIIPAHDEIRDNQVRINVPQEIYVVTIRGYLGIDAQSATGASSFYVLSTENTYSMDLGISDESENGYEVAEAFFSYFNVVEGAEGVQNANILPTNPDEKFTIYVSPTRDYHNTSAQFMFIKIGSEHQARTNANTIYYRLDWNSENPSNDNKTNAPLYMRPTYTYKQISRASSGSTGKDRYQIRWEMDNTIMLYLTNESLQSSLEHQEGMYYSYIYFTLVSN